MKASKNEKRLIAERIKSILGEDANSLFDNVSATTYSRIANASHKECLTLVATNTSNSVQVIEPIPPSTDYLSAIIAFCRKKTWRGKNLDSALSAPVSEAVATVFAEHIESKTDKIVEESVPILINSEKFVDAISISLIDSYNKPIPTHIKSKISNILSLRLKSILSSQIDSQATIAIKNAAVQVAGSVSAPMAAKIGIILIKAISTTLKPIIVKMMASAAFKAAVVAKVKAVIGAAILGAIVKFLGSKLALTTGGAFMFILLPIFVTWLARESYLLPRKMAIKVSESVRNDLEDNFDDLSEDLSEKIAKYLAVSAAGLVASELIDDKEIAEMLEAAILESKT